MQSPYLLIPLLLGVLLLYFFSQLLQWLGIILKKNHRKFWNTVLLFTFLTTAILGLLLAIQINYKLEWPAFNQFLKWHVNVGIAMSIVAVIHLLWHIDYYLKLFRKTKQFKTETSRDEAQTTQEFKDPFLVSLTGFAATVIQVLILRELTTVFQGNEILMTWTIGIWMVLTGSGSLMGIRLKAKGELIDFITGLLLAVVLLPVLILILLLFFRNIIFLPGMIINPWLYFLTATIVLAPVCLLSGLLFSLFIKGNRSEEKSFINVYLYESLGSVLGGLAVSFLFIEWFSVLQSFIILGVIVCISLYLRSRKNLFIVITGGLVTTAILLWIYPLELHLKSLLFPGSKVVVSRETYFGNLTITSSANEYNFFLNGSLLYNSGNFIQYEEFVHYAMLQHEHPENVMVVSGGIAGMTHEVLKYPSVKRIDYLEINRQLVEYARNFELFTDTGKVHIYYTDINRFLSSHGQQYDVVIMAVPDPTSLQMNRYYTDEFIHRLKPRLRPSAVLIYGLNASGNYLSKWQSLKYALIYNTLRKSFRYCEIIPGDKDYFLASDSHLEKKISELASARHIENEYVNPYYIDDNSIDQRGELIRQQLDRELGINRDDKALPVFYSTLKYLSQFHSNFRFILILPFLLLMIFVFSLKKELKGMFMAGFSGASVEVLLLFVFQLAFGYIYAAIGVLIALFMAGLVIGAAMSRKIPLTRKTFRFSFLYYILYLLILSAFLALPYTRLSPYILWPVIILLMLIPSGLTGFIYSVSSRLAGPDPTRSAPAVYSVDLLGASLGMIIMTLILIPVAGLSITCLLLVVMNIVPLVSALGK